MLLSLMLYVIILMVTLVLVLFIVICLILVLWYEHLFECIVYALLMLVYNLTNLDLSFV